MFPNTPIWLENHITFFSSSFFLVFLAEEELCQNVDFAQKTYIYYSIYWWINKQYKIAIWDRIITTENEAKPRNKGEKS